MDVMDFKEFSLRERSDPMASNQSFSYMVKSMRLVFSYLKTSELLIASRVCVSWNIIAMDRGLWQTVRLKNSMVCNWKKAITAFHNNGTVTLNTRRMLLPTKFEEIEMFWHDFITALEKAQKLKCIELYRCPSYIVEKTISLLPQLTVLNVTSIKNPITSEEKKNCVEIILLNLHDLDQLTQLTELRIKGLTGIKLSNVPSFESLVNLKFLSITSVEIFPKNVCKSLKTITTNLEFFEIGDCYSITKDFVGVLKRLINLKSLRLENCGNNFKHFVRGVFRSIRSLEKLEILQLINIEINDDVEVELAICSGIKVLMIIPMYNNEPVITVDKLKRCLPQLSDSLTHLVWGVTQELLHYTDSFMTNSIPLEAIPYKVEVSEPLEATNNIPLLITKKPRVLPEKDDNEKDKPVIDIIPVPTFEKILKSLMNNTKIKVIKIPIAFVTRVNLLDYFKNLY